MKNKKIKILISALLIVCLTVVLTACGESSNQEAAPAEDASAEEAAPEEEAAPTEDASAEEAAPEEEAAPAEENTPAPENTGETYTMRIGTPTTNDIQVYEMERFKETLESKTDQIVVELYPSGQLGSNSDMLQGLQGGSIQALLEPTPFLGGFCSELNVVDLPYFWKDVFSATEILNSSDGDILRDFMAQRGIYVPSFYSYGDRVTLTTFPITSMDDLKGKKIRIMGAQVLIDEYQAWGASGVAMDVPELYTALQQGTIDGLESAPQFFNMGKYYEVAKYMFYEPKGAEVTIFMMNKDWYDSLPADLQAAVTESAEEIRADVEAEAARTMDEATQNMIDTVGLEVIQPSEELHAQMVEAAKETVHQNFLAANPDAVDIYNTFKEVIEAGE